MQTHLGSNPVLFPPAAVAAYQDVLPRRKQTGKAKYVNLPVAVILKLRKLGVGPLCAYAAITFQAAVGREEEVVVPSRTWKMFGCQADHRHRQVKALIQAGLVAAKAGRKGKPTRFRLIGPAKTSAE